MGVHTLEAPLQPQSSEYLPVPLDANARLYAFHEIAAAAPYFVAVGDPVQMHCNSLEESKDGYNPSGVEAVKVFANDTTTTNVTIVRTEEGEGAYAAQSRFCTYDESGELIELNIPRRPWEDAAMCVLPDGTIVTSGVHVIWDKEDPTKVERFFTEYYSGPSLEEQVYLGQSPDGHKDSRLGIINGKPILWIRPQQRSLEGKIYFTPLSSIQELRGTANKAGERVAQEVYDRAKPVGAGVFADGTWGGPNDAKDVGNGWALLECHTSRRLFENAVSEDENGKHGDSDILMEYAGFMLLHHPETGKAYIFGPHAYEHQFPPGGTKWPKVRRVAFPGGSHGIKVSPDGHIEGTSVYGIRDKYMYYIRWRTAISLAHLLRHPADTATSMPS